MISILGLLLAFAASASDKDLFDKTYPRDNAFCQVGKSRMELMVRGDHSHTEPKERMWGEHVFARLGTPVNVHLPVTQQSGLYRMFPGSPSSCTKAVGSMVGDKFAVLFQKLNSPHKNLLVIQYFDPRTLQPIQTVHTSYLSDYASASDNSFVFRTHPPYRQDIEMGNVMIQGKKYLFQDHVFPIWIRLDERGFSTDLKTTFEKFTYAGYFKNLDDFKTYSGWLDGEKVFENTRLYVAINHASKSRCILLVKEQKPLTGEESWLCQ